MMKIKKTQFDMRRKQEDADITKEQTKLSFMLWSIIALGAVAITVRTMRK